MHTLSVTLVGLFFSLTNPQKGEWPQKNTKSSSICFISVCVCGSIPVMLDFFFRVSMPFVFLMCSRHLWFWMQRLTTVPGNSFGGLLPGNASARYMRVVNPRATLVLFAFTFELLSFSTFQAALLIVQPSAKREGFATIPDVTWEDVGALKDVREELTMAILVTK